MKQKSHILLLWFVCFASLCVLIMTSLYGVSRTQKDHKKDVERYMNDVDQEDGEDNEDNTWQPIDGLENMKTLSTSGDLVCGTTVNDQILCGKRNSSKWTTLPGHLSQLSVSGNKICGVNKHEDIYCADNVWKPDWKHIPGKLKQVDLSGNLVCGIGTDYGIYCADFMNANWRRLPGWLSQLSVSGRTLCGVNDQKDLYCTDSTYKADWKHIDKNISFVDVSGNKMCGIGANGEIMCADYAQRNWQRKPGAAKWLGFDDGNAYVVGTDGKGYHSDDIHKMKFVKSLESTEITDVKKSERITNGVLLTKDGFEELRYHEDRACKPVAEALGEDAAKQYASINKYLLVNCPEDRCPNEKACYIKDVETMTSGDCDKSNKDLYDKRVIKRIEKRTITDPYVSNTVPIEVCTLAFKDKTNPKHMKEFMTKLDSLAPNVRVVAEQLQGIKENSDLLDDSVSFEMGNLNTAKDHLENKNRSLKLTIDELGNEKNNIANIDRTIEETKKKIDETKDFLKFGWF